MATLPVAPADGATPASVPTPGRHTHVRFDVPEQALLRPAWGMARKPEQIGIATQAGFGNSTNVSLLASGAWTLFPLQYGWRWEAYEPGFTVIELEVLLAIAAINAKFLQKPPSLPGVSLGTGANPDPFNKFLTIQMPVGVMWSEELASDLVNRPKPPLPTQYIATRRIVAGKETYPENQGYCLRFMVPASAFQAQDTLCTFYFGGDTDCYPAGQGKHGGDFGLSLRGDGTAWLWERCANAAGDDKEWRKVFEFRYTAPGQVSGKVHTLLIIPHWSDRMDIICETTGLGNNLGTTKGPRKAGTHSTNTAVYHHNALVTQVTAKKFMTGPGTVALDVRSDLRPLFQMSRLYYPASGILEDHNFQVPFAVADSTKLHLNWRAYLPPGTSITAKIHDSASRDPLTEGTTGVFDALPGEASYFVRFTFSTTDRYRTPVLYGFSVRIAGMTIVSESTPFEAGFARRVSITGPSNDPTQETGSFILEDMLGQANRLLWRGRIHTQVTVQDDTVAGGSVVLLEGEIARANALVRGRTARAYPSPAWREYDCSMVSMWARNSGQMWLGQFQDFSEDPNADPDPNRGGHRPPMKITDIARIVFQEGLGYPNDMLDIPDVEFRAFPSSHDPYEYILHPTANVMEYLQKLVRDYLGYFIVWDANAGTRGMWRIRPPTLSAGSPLWSFTTSPPGPGKLPQVPGAYGARTSPIWHYSSHVRAPEANYVVVCSTGELLPGANSPLGLTQYAYNKASYNYDGAHPADPDHPDYLGFFLPLVYFNANLAVGSEKENEAAINWVTRRLYEQVAHAQKWVRFSAPLVLVDDSSDTHLGGKRRPLRYYDPITVNGSGFLVHSVEMDIESDFHQEMTVEALAVDNTLVPPDI